MATSAVYVPGFSWRNAVGPNDNPRTDVVTWPFDGVLPTDHFTIVFYIRSKGMDYLYQPATGTFYHWFFDVDGSGTNGLYVVRTASSPTAMRLRWHFEPLILEAGLNLQLGDIPADTWKRIVCTWDGRVLSIATGDNIRQYTSHSIRSIGGNHWSAGLANNVAFSASCSVLDGMSGGLYVNGGGPNPANSGGPFDIEGPYVYRYKRSFSTGFPAKARTITVDSSVSQGAFPLDVGGVLNQYSGIEFSGNASTDLDVAGRDAVIVRAANAGLKTIRFPDLTAYMRFNYSAGAPNRGISAHDWSDFDSRVNLWKQKGVTRFHADFLGTPVPLQPGAFPFSPTACIGRGSTTLPVPARTSKMTKGTALFISERGNSETLFLSADYGGGAGYINVSATATAYGTAAVVNQGKAVGGANREPRYAPPIDNEAWGQICVDAVDRLINTHRVDLVHLGFWNEPLSANYYGGNKAAYVAQWLAAADRINSDDRITPSGVKLSAGECASWVPHATSAEENETGWQKAIIEQAVASDLPMPAVSYHAYSGDLNLERRLIQDQFAYLETQGLPKAKVRIGEWNMDADAAGQVDQPNAIGSIHPDVWENEYLAAFAHAFVIEAMDAGVDTLIFTRLQQLDDRYPGGEQHLHLFSRDSPAKAFGVGAYFQMLWKVPADAVRFSCTSNWPDVRVLGARSGASPTTYTIVYGRYRPWRNLSGPAAEVDFEWNHLPKALKWKQWHLDRKTISAEGLVQVAAGNATNLPGSVSLLPLSAGCIQIVG
jgi:hypothetical protein